MIEGRNANAAFKTEGITVDNLLTIIDRELESDPFIVRWLIDSSLYNDPDRELLNIIPTTEDVHKEMSKPSRTANNARTINKVFVIYLSTDADVY